MKGGMRIECHGGRLAGSGPSVTPPGSEIWPAELPRGWAATAPPQTPSAAPLARKSNCALYRAARARAGPFVG